MIFSLTVAISPQHRSVNSYDPSVCGTTGYSFDSISTSTVLSHLSSLDASKSTGPNSLTTAFWKEVTSEISVLLTNFFNQSLHDAMIPVVWKQRHIIPVKKGGKCDNPSNYICLF